MRRIGISAPLHCWLVLVVASGNCAAVGNDLWQASCGLLVKKQVASTLVHFKFHRLLLLLLPHCNSMLLSYSISKWLICCFAVACCTNSQRPTAQAQAAESRRLSELEEMLQLLWRKRLALPGSVSSHGCGSYCCCNMTANENINAPSKQSESATTAAAGKACRLTNDQRHDVAHGSINM